MSRLAKKILSAFVEVTPPNYASASQDSHSQAAAHMQRSSDSRSDGQAQLASDSQPSVQARQGGATQPVNKVSNERFSSYFDKLFSESNLPGPDYYEFSKMISAMAAIADEQSRFYAAYAGLQVQGLDKTKLLSTAGDYLKILDADAAHFKSTVATTLQEKVTGKQAEAEEKSRRIQSLSREISDLQQEIIALQASIRESEGKIADSTDGYTAESEGRKARIMDDIEKINRFIH